jgi:hypothetical protein
MVIVVYARHFTNIEEPKLILLLRLTYASGLGAILVIISPGEEVFEELVFKYHLDKV